MAVTNQPRTNLPQWSAGTDPFTRAQMNQAFLDLENNASLFAAGTLAARPAAGISGRWYYATDRALWFWDDGTTWVNTSPALTKEWAREGALTVRTGAARWRVPYDLTIISVYAMIDTPPVGASVIVDVNRALVASPQTKTTIFTTQANRPTIAASAYMSGLATPNVVDLAQNEHVTVDIDQIGTTTAGSDLTVQLTYRRR